jgi:hypothetical protein
MFSHSEWLRDLSFEEGILKIGVSAFESCYKLEKAAFPASLIVIEANAFQFCGDLRQITFAVGSQLQYIRSEAFLKCPLNEVVIPASILEIDSSAFSIEVWRKSATPLFSIDDDFLLSADSRVIFRYLSSRTELLIGSNTQVIGANAFRKCRISSVLFESGTRLREIGSGAFAKCKRFTTFNIPESVEVIGDHCFASCSWLETVEF